MTDHEVQVRFEELQSRLAPLWRSIRQMTDDEQTIVVVPSMTLEKVDEIGSAMQAYEERFLFLLLLLRQPRARMIYVTSQPIHPSIIDYYLGLLPGVIPSHARKRLDLLAPCDSSSRPLTEKLLERPRLLHQIRSLIPDLGRAHLVPYTTTEIERDLAVALGIPMYGADPRYFHLGTKSGCRKLFEQESVLHPMGIEDLYSLEEVATALVKMRSLRPDAPKAIVKLNEGVAGGGNATVDLAGLPSSGDPAEAQAVAERLEDMSFEDPTATFDNYVGEMQRLGAIVEERIEGTEVRSPSVQMRVTPLGELEVLSTHDQLLGGATGQVYLGCTFPADEGYATAITVEAEKVGKRLAREGVIGRFAVDFVVVRNDDGWDVSAIELNLRKGGTTHPYLTLQFLTDGSYDAGRGVFETPNGDRKFFVASDHVESEAYKRLTPDDLFDAVVTRRLHFDQSRQEGVVFHMMSVLSEYGRVGLTAVGNSHAEAARLYDETIKALNEEAAWEPAAL